MDVIDTSVMPGDDMEPDAIEAAAGKIRASGAAVSTTATTTHTAWTKISASYEAPEQGQLFAAMNPVTKEAEVFKTDLGTAATALETFAETVRTIKAAVVTIRADVSTFENKIASDGTIQPAGGYNPYAGGMKLRIQWNEDKGMVAEQKRLAAAINAQRDAMQAAEIACANSIDDITGAAHVPTSGPGAPAAPPHVADAQWYLTAPIDRKEDCGERIAHGVVIDLGGGMVSGLLGLVGVKFDTTTGDFGNFFSTLGETWGGLLKMNVGTNPLLWLPLTGLGAGKYVDQSRQAVWGFLNDQIARDPFAKDPWHRYKEDPLRAGSYAVANLATWFFAPVKALTVGKAGKAAGLAGDAAKAGDLAKAGEVTRFGSAADLVKALRESGSLKSLRELPETLRARLAGTSGKASDLVHAGDDLKTPQLSQYDLTADRANPRTEVPTVRDGGPGVEHPAHLDVPQTRSGTSLVPGPGTGGPLHGSSVNHPPSGAAQHPLPSGQQVHVWEDRPSVRPGTHPIDSTHPAMNLDGKSSLERGAVGEALTKQRLHDDGWSLFRNGRQTQIRLPDKVVGGKVMKQWFVPDFIASKDGRLMLVESKTGRGAHFTANQLEGYRLYGPGGAPLEARSVLAQRALDRWLSGNGGLSGQVDAVQVDRWNVEIVPDAGLKARSGVSVDH